MNKKVMPVQLIFFAVAVAIAIAGVLFFAGKKGNTKEQVIASEPDFGKNNYNVMKRDSFVALTNIAYSNFATFSNSDGNLILDIKNANQLARDFFNGNDSLLQFELGDYGFEIKYDAAMQSVHAVFEIDKQNGVNVPNDVLIKLMDKAYNR